MKTDENETSRNLAHNSLLFISIASFQTTIADSIFNNYHIIKPFILLNPCDKSPEEDVVFFPALRLTLQY